VEMQVGKRDLFTVAVLCIVFLSIAMWNVGMTRVPLTTWQATGDESFYIDLGRNASVETVYFLVKGGCGAVEVYTGSPEDWSDSGAIGLQGYYSWNNVSIDRDTQYLRFDFQQASVEIVEIAVLGKGNHKLAISGITALGPADQNLHRLIDEQGLVEVPPTYASETYFDEIYYVSSAESYLKLQQPYEWTHPPLGKLVIASGIELFGYNPFGWRIMGVLFATLMIALIYLVGKELFGTWIGAFAPAFLLTFDFMHFTMGRIATVDTFVVLFSLGSQLFFLIYIQDLRKNGWKVSTLPLLLAVFFFALSFSTKWLALFGFAGQLAILLALRLKDAVKLNEGCLSIKVKGLYARPFFLLALFLGLAIFVYFTTYIPDMLAGSTLTDIFKLQEYMFTYHSELEATQPFASPWWTWPLILKPVWLFTSYLPADLVSTIVLIGNPAVWWVGFVFVILAFGEAMEIRDFPCIYITVLFFVQWLPYVFISRPTFLYHFYTNVPFLCLAVGYFLNRYWSKKWGKAAALAYFSVVVVLFLLFYPAISGMPTPVSRIASLRLLES